MEQRLNAAAVSIPRGCGRAVIAFARAYDQAFARGLHVEGTVRAYGWRVRRRIGDEILAAQLRADVEKRLRQVVDAIREERVAAGLISEFLQDFVAGVQMIFVGLFSVVPREPIRIRAHGENSSLGFD